MVTRRREMRRLTPAPVDARLHDMLTWTEFNAQNTSRRNRTGQLAVNEHTVATKAVRVTAVSRDHQGRHDSVQLTSMATELQREAPSAPVACWPATIPDAHAGVPGLLLPPRRGPTNHQKKTMPVAAAAMWGAVGPHAPNKSNVTTTIATLSLVTVNMPGRGTGLAN